MEATVMLIKEKIQNMNSILRASSFHSIDSIGGALYLNFLHTFCGRFFFKRLYDFIKKIA